MGGLVMDRTTDEAVAVALQAVRDRAEAERLARRAFHRAEGRRQIVTAAGIDVDDLSEHARRILDWLADWDQPTIGGVVELVATTRAAAAGSSTGDRP
jgi:single-stranded DNA-specific DHH superfamily exonuclease